MCTSTLTQAMVPLLPQLSLKQELHRLTCSLCAVFVGDYTQIPVGAVPGHGELLPEIKARTRRYAPLDTILTWILGTSLGTLD
jgi:hypothetical protein